MAYQVLARKWRPQDFASLVGQGPIVTALSNALTEGRIAQAYLFSGIRGVGKTTTARLLAKALNCEQGPTAEPCNQCLACTEITRGSDMDVIEVDAATYSKVEQVRELTEGLRYGPARDRYKVVVIDEIHRLSRQAFDALLKIVEEPPEHLVFIFATTEMEAVPATILSRCQEFRFRRVGVDELAQHLRRICDAEEIETTDNALRLIARAGEGSVRDAVALLDQLATFGSGAVRDEDAARLSGSLDSSLFIDLLAAIVGGRAGEVSGTVKGIEQEGWDPRHVFGQFLAHTRDALHLALGGGPDTIDLPADDAAELAELAGAAGYENLLRVMQLLLASEESVRRSEVGILAVEIALLRAAELPKLTRIEELLAGPLGGAGGGGGSAGGRGGGGGSAGGGSSTHGGGGGTGGSRPGSAARRSSGARAARQAIAEGREEAERRERVQAVEGRQPSEPPRPEREAAPPTADGPTPGPPTHRPPAEERSAEPAAEERSVEPAAEERPEEPPETSSGASGESAPAAAGPAAEGANGSAASVPPADAAEGVERLLDEVLRRRHSLGAILKESHDLRFDSGRLLIAAPPKDPVDLALGRKGNRRVLEEALAAVWGAGTEWQLKHIEVPARREPEDRQEPDAEHPTVQAVLDIFDGTLETEGE